jgi:aminopeptidase YwaD
MHFLRRRVVSILLVLAVCALAPASAVGQPAPPAPSGEAAFAHVQHLAGAIGPRATGTPSERQAAEYLAAQFRQFGYQVDLHSFRFPYFEARRVELQQLGAASRPVPAMAFFYSAPTALGGLDADVVHAGLGRPSDYEGRQVTGAVALVERGSITFGDKAANAAARGAVAVVIYNNQPEGFMAGVLPQPSRIPAVMISREDGLRMVEAAQQGRLRVRLLVDTVLETRSTVNFVATKRGAARPGEIIVVGAHYDSVPSSPGANDNASGVAVVLEAARVLAGTPTPRTIQFVLFAAEELGLFGSVAFADERRGGVVAMINLDMVGWGSVLMAGSSPGRDETMVNAALEVARTLGILVNRFRITGSDHASFERVGIPAVFLHRGVDPHYHRPSDLPSIVDPRNLEEAARLVVGILLHPALPSAVVGRRRIGMAAPELPVLPQQVPVARVG